uniref:UPF0750 membrane protein yitE n=3 Tax=Anthurium amnicola TaxID=1678845 RepID=A0A1D1Y654_9ARAE
MLEGRLSEKGIPVGDSVYDSYIQNKKRGDLLKLPNSNAASGFLTDPISTLLEKNDNAYPGKANDNGADLLNDTGGSQEISLVDAGSGKEGSEDPANSERSQVLGAAAVILNMLDVTMPGTLGNEQKEKVLTAMEQGETLMKALQGAVPEDVRWKLTAAVSEIVQTQGTKINIDNLKKIGWVPRMPSTRKSKIQEQPRDISTADGPNGAHFADHRKTGASIPESLHGDSVSHHISDHDAQENIDSSQEKSLEASRYTESMTKVDGKQSQYGEPDVASGSLDTSDRVVNQSHRVDERHDDCRAKLVADDSHYSETKKLDAVAGDKMANSSSNCEQSHTSDSSSVEHQQSHKERNDVQEINNENVQHSIKFEEPLSNDSNHSSGNPPPISVSQALDALTGFDDSTQMAVNSVFGVIESMIDQLEKGKDKLDGEESKGGVLESDDSSEQSLVTSNHKSDNVYAKNASGLRSDVMQSDPPQDSFLRKPVDPREDMRVRRDEKKLIHDLNSSDSGAFGRFLGTNFNFNKDGSLEKVLLNFNVNPYWESPCRAYLHKYFSSQMSNRQALNSQSATDLFLDPEEGRWKMLDQMESSSPIHNMEEHQGINVDQMSQSMLQEIDKETIIEPSYAILDTEQSRIPANNDKQDDHDYFRREELALLVKYTVLDALKVEVARRLGMLDLKEADSGIKHDLERISDAVSCAVLKHSELSSEYKESSSAKLGTIQGQWIIRTISYVVHDTSHLGKVLPAGVIVGSTLASLRKYFHVTVLDDELKVEAATDGPISFREKHSDKECDIRNAHDTLRKKEQNINLDPSDQVVSSTVEISTPRNDRAMVGAVTVALGASALLAHHQTNKAHMSTGLSEISSNPMKVEESSLKLHDKLVEVAQDKTQNNLITTLAEKAMSVAGPVVPTKNDGEVDHERLIATLAELGQKGGMLRLIGKIALLWGGIRGAMSLTDRLISFLHIAERPLFQRILGFVSMVLVMWSPVVIPLLPTLVESWTLKRFTGIAEYACIAGLYVAIMILVVLWGRRIRGYENPLKQYGLDLRSASQVRDFTKGFLGGTMLVLYVHSVSALLGYACLVRPSDLPSSSVHVAMLFKTYGWMLIQTLKGVVTAACIAIVEELLFRSWLPDEIAVDLGYRRSIIISGILFSLLQRSLTSIPGFLFLSLALFGAKQRGNGSLLLPIGIRTGIMTANFVVQTGGFLTYRSATPFWLASTHPWHPFDGAVGLGICILMAVFLYPRRPTQGKENSRVT